MTEECASSRTDRISVDALSHPHAVRDTLQKLMPALAAWGIQAHSLHKIELVVAEALNNVYEHACAYQDGVHFSTTAQLDPPHLRIDIVDCGTPMPGGVLPPQATSESPHPKLDVAPARLPEGGWGWMLIRDLTDAMRYERRRDRNHLTLHMRVT